METRMRAPSRFVAVVATVLLMLLGAHRVAHADPKGDVQAKIKEAMENYDLLEYEAARKLLNQALAIAKKGKLDADPVTAKVHLSLGIVYFAGIQDKESAKLAFQSAVQIDPKIQIDAAYKTPEMAKVLDEARAEAKGNAGGPSNDSGGDCASVKGLAHTIIDSAKAGAPQTLDVQLGSDVPATKVSILYRPEGSTSFTEAKMTKQGDCKYTGTIPAAGLKGGLTHYYIAAFDGSGKILASKGSAGSPNIIELSGTGGGTAAPNVKGDGEDPLGTGGGTPTTGGGDISKGVEVGPKKPTVMLAVTVGSGMGYVTGSTEQQNNKVECCVAPGLLVVMPELGFYTSPTTTISIAGRLGFPLGANIDGHAPIGPGGLLRLRHWLSSSGEGLRVMGQVGAGIIRNTIKLSDASNGMDTDIVALGPLLVGAGAGYTKGLGGSLALVADVSAVAGLPVTNKIGTSTVNFGLQVDVSLGLAVGF
jgi:hypothetical protein